MAAEDLPDAPDIGPSPLLGRPGAVAARDDGIDDGLAWHYGDPMGEQRAAAEAVLLDHWTSGLVTVSGEDRLTWLHSLTTQHLSELPDGSATEALWLSPQGRIEHQADVVELGGTVYLRTEPGRAATLRAFLESMRFWAKVDIADVTADHAAMTVQGRQAGRIVQDTVGIPAPAAGRAAALPDPMPGYLRGRPDGVDLVTSREAFAQLAARLIMAGAVPAGTWAADALRLPTRRPRLGIDIDERTIPNEVSWLATAVHLHKGCYRGQETVARVDNLGLPPRRLVLLHLDGSAEALPVTGDPVLSDGGRTVGRVGSVAQHWEDGPIALALVKRTVGPGTPLLAGSADALIDPDDAVAADLRPPSVDRAAFRDVRRR